MNRLHLFSLFFSQRFWSQQSLQYLLPLKDDSLRVDPNPIPITLVSGHWPMWPQNHPSRGLEWEEGRIEFQHGLKQMISLCWDWVSPSRNLGLLIPLSKMILWINFCNPCGCTKHLEQLLWKFSSSFFIPNALTRNNPIITRIFFTFSLPCPQEKVSGPKTHGAKILPLDSHAASCSGGLLICASFESSTFPLSWLTII